jgi:hypothetical protein
MGSMSNQISNPFQITKSNDLTDEQIDQFWVTAGVEDGVTGLPRPTSRMAMFILGGKGSGKSHLMRYYSFPVQLIRHRRRHSELADTVLADGYVGIYARCGGLNAQRFEGKRQPDEKWRALFAYYFELWVAHETLTATETLLSVVGTTADQEREIAKEIMSLFDKPTGDCSSIAEIQQLIAKLRRDLDYAVNNAAIHNELSAEVLVTRGNLFFGIPRLICEKVDRLKDMIFVYMLDEFENFTVPQQIYINTLIRERQGPTAFRVGARLYGIRTRETLSGGERNLEGSEYEELRLDERFRKNDRGYEAFAFNLLARRISAARNGDGWEPEVSRLEHLFEEPDLSIDSEFLRSICPFGSVENRPHMVSFHRKLVQGIDNEVVVGPRKESDAKEIIESISFPESPLIEKICILYLYQQWFRWVNLMEAVKFARDSAKSYLEGSRASNFDEFIRKHKGDMVAQLLRENGRQQIYAGLRSFIRMSEGLPRSLITILKHVYDWSVYTQERPFQGGRISIKAQQSGVVEAADWFLDQMLEPGDDGIRVRSAVERMSQLCRINRFADKPVETSLVAFSVDEIQLLPEALRILAIGRNTSVLIDVARGQRERNSEQVTSKVELNLMLAPRWDLPIARRGVAPLSSDEANCVLVLEQRNRFGALSKTWEAKMSAPFFGRPRGAARSRVEHPDLFG